MKKRDEEEQDEEIRLFVEAKKVSSLAVRTKGDDKCQYLCV